MTNRDEVIIKLLYVSTFVKSIIKKIPGSCDKNTECSGEIDRMDNTRI